VKKTVTGLLLIFALLFSVAISVNLATASLFNPPYLPELTINSDGSITGPEFINRTGNVYTLTADIEGYAVVIERSNIVFDGAEHSINTTEGENAGLKLTDVKGVTVKNLEVFSRYTSIYLYYSSNCLLTNVKTNYRIYLTDGCNSNTITKSNVAILHVGLTRGAINNLIIKNNILQELAVSGSDNIFSQNNILFNYTPGTYITSTDHWDNGSLGNYWSDYLTMYPDASEVGNTGIGDAPYVIDAYNVDNYPLMYPYDIENDAIAFPTPEPQPEPEPFPTLLVATASAASATLICVSLLVYFAKLRKRGETAGGKS